MPYLHGVAHSILAHQSVHAFLRGIFVGYTIKNEDLFFLACSCCNHKLVVSLIGEPNTLLDSHTWVRPETNGHFNLLIASLFSNAVHILFGKY